MNDLPAIASSEAAEAYLDAAEPYIAAILQEAEDFEMEPELFEILERFLDLEDERNPDGSIDSHFLSYHLRIVNRLVRAYCKNVIPSYLPEHTVNMLVGANFNKPSVVEYYQRKIPLWVALKEIPNPHTNVIPNSDTVGFNPLHEMLEAKGHETFPAKAKAYDETKPSLKDYMKASVEVAVD